MAVKVTEKPWSSDDEKKLKIEFNTNLDLGEEHVPVSEEKIQYF